MISENSYGRFFRKFQNARDFYHPCKIYQPPPPITNRPCRATRMRLPDREGNNSVSNPIFRPPPFPAGQHTGASLGGTHCAAPTPRPTPLRPTTPPWGELAAGNLARTRGEGNFPYCQLNECRDGGQLAGQVN